ncbi:sulfatase [Fusarium heterosporum]|uniref:Sulfatase n=1 Tax=Fusarium heterosporum TaxID=42747 RepID=A0A8H5WNS5_FUSHE|nr:sulfatase [Fusarium heterosporum]
MVSFKKMSSFICSRLANRKFAFALVTLAVCAAKGVHLHNHRSSVAPKRMILFFFSFFTQDILLLLFIRLLLSHWVPSFPGKLRNLVYIVSTYLISYNVALGIVSVSFYLVAGSEIRWRNIGFISDPSARAVLFSGFTAFLGVLCLCLCLSGVLQTACYGLFGWGADIVNWPIAFLYRKLCRCTTPRNAYEQISQHNTKYDLPQWSDSSDAGSSHDEHSEDEYKEKSRSSPASPRRSSRRVTAGGNSTWLSSCGRFLRVLPYIVVSILLTALFTLSFLRPKDPSLIFLSWTSGLLPFVDFASTSPFLDDLPSVFGSGVQRGWDERTALVQPEPLSWLSKNTPPMEGFEDWHANEPHYSAASDPLKISNLEEPLRESLRGKLKDIKIRHVVMLFLESTRNDVFPIKKDSLIWNRFADTFPDKQLPKEVQDKLASLTPTANFITGDYEDGFKHAKQTKRGGIHFTNAHTAGTYTLKSMTGTVCGVAPLVADFNLEHSHHIYQPCLPHIFEAMNKAENTDTREDKWNSYFYQAATADYDNQHNLMAAMGYPREHTIDRKYLRSPEAKHGAVTLPDINEFAFQEDPLEDYINDVFDTAAKEKSRVFLTHLTSTSHHRFHLPKTEKYTPLAKGLDMMSRYINTIGYDDRWIRKILDVLDKQGIANETLVILQGDHGTSLPENDYASPYYNPNIGVDHVPLILSHPQLPPFNVDDAVHSTQVLPTILDFLLETGSLSETSRKAATDLIRNYEGQSLLRPLNTSNKSSGQGQWQFTVTNPGRAMLTVRDARYPDRHLVVPVIENVDWRLSDLSKDPHEHDPVQALDFESFILGVEEKFGHEVAEWAEEGAFVTRWYVKENSRRWRFDHQG